MSSPGSFVSATLKEMSQLSLTDPSSPTMGSFPDDVLTLVLKSTPFTPEELSNLCLVCKRSKDIATEFLYCAVCLRHNHHNLVKLSNTLSRNKSLALMVKHFTFDWATLSLRLDSPAEQIGYHCLMSHWYKDRMSEVKHLSDREAVDATISMLCCGILVMMKNLETLEMGFVSHKMELCIWKDAGKGIILPKLLSFVQLDRRLTPNSKEPKYVQFNNDGPLSPVMPTPRHWVINFYPVFLVPSLRKVKASHILGVHDKFDYDKNLVGELPLSHFFGTSSVESIDISMACLPETALMTLLRLPRELKELRYEHAPGTVPTPLKSIGNAIRCRRRSLVRLSFRGLWSASDTLEEFVINFRDFKALKELSVSLHLLVKSRKEPFSEAEIMKPKTPQTPLSIPPLHTLLPRGLEKFTFLMSKNYFADIFEAIRCLIREKAAHFPRLKMIGFELISEGVVQWSILQDLASLAHEHGVRLAMPDKEDEDPFALKPLPCHADVPGYPPMSGLDKLTLNRMLEKKFKDMLK